MARLGQFGKKMLHNGQTLKNQPKFAVIKNYPPDFLLKLGKVTLKTLWYEFGSFLILMIAIFMLTSQENEAQESY